MALNEAATAPIAPIAPRGRPRRSAWLLAAQALLALGIWVSYRTERRIVHDTMTVTVIANVNSEGERAHARRARDPRDDIAEIYGVPVGGPLDVVPSSERARRISIQPVEDPIRRLVPLAEFDRFEKPLAVRLTGHGIAIGCLAAGLLAFILARRQRRPAPPAPNPPSPTTPPRPFEPA